MKKLARPEMEAKIAELQSEISGLKDIHLAELQTVQTNKESEKLILHEQIQKIESENTEARDHLNETIEELEKQLKEKQNQLNKRELKKLAEAYSDQEDAMKEETWRWFWIVIGTFLLLLLTITLSAYLANGKLWYERLEYYLGDFVFVTFLIFSLKQYSAANRIRFDFANRKTLAQSYQNIISTSDDLVLRDKFLERAADLLCAPVDQKTESHTLPEKALDSVTEIAKNLSRRT